MFLGGLKGSEGVVARRGLYREPAQFGEFVHARAAAKSAQSARLDAAEQHRRFIVDGGTVDVANAGITNAAWASLAITAAACETAVPESGLRRSKVTPDEVGTPFPPTSRLTS
jgi:hypothetical protein